MSINDLREMADYAKLEIDGSRETLIASLKRFRGRGEEDDGREARDAE